METGLYTQEDVQENKIMALLGYLGILLLIPLLAKKDSPYAQFHAKQGLVLLIAWIGTGVIGIIPVLGWVLAPICSIILLVFLIIGIINALSGQVKPLPLIGKYADKFNI